MARPMPRLAPVTRTRIGWEKVEKMVDTLRIGLKPLVRLMDQQDSLVVCKIGRLIYVNVTNIDKASMYI